jgi:hypothetical protein
MIVAATTIAIAYQTQNAPMKTTDSSKPSTSSSSSTAAATNTSFSSNVTDGLRLSATIDPTVVDQGGNLTVTAEVSNTLPTDVSVNATSMTNPAYGPCQQDFATGIHVYEGSYTSANISKLLLYNPSLIYTCPEVFTFHYYFSPESDVATVHTTGAPGNTTGPISEASTVNGYWTGSGQNYAFQPFPLGTYTIEVFDAWGQTTIGHFQVSTQTGTASVTTVSSSSGLELKVGLNSTSMASGGSVAASVSLFNSLGQNLSLTTNYAADSTIAKWNGYDFLCGEPIFSSMIGYAVFQGRYVADNLSLAAGPLQLSPPLNAGCVTYPNPVSIVFLPGSDTAVLYPQNEANPNQEQVSVVASTESCSINSAGAYLCGLKGGFSGYWNTAGLRGNLAPQNATTDSQYFHYLPDGEYTLAVQDMWGQTVFAYFQVTPASTTATTASTECTISGEGTGFYLTVLSDSGQPIQGARVTGTSSPCLQDIGTYVTNSTGSVLITPNIASYYQLSITYQGQSYTVKAPIEPMTTTYVTLRVPSGNVTISEVFEGGCQTNSEGVSCPG